MIAFLAALAALVVGYVVGRRHGIRWASFDSKFKVARAKGQFEACDAALNALKAKHAETLMQLEDARAAKGAP